MDSTTPIANDQDNDSSPTYMRPYSVDEHNHNLLLLLWMTWLLPLVAPVLAVWVRTLITAGIAVPFESDHNFLNVAPFVILVEFLSSRRLKITTKCVSFYSAIFSNQTI